MLSPAAAYTPLVGAQVTVPAGTSVRLSLERDFEYGVLVADGRGG